MLQSAFSIEATSKYIFFSSRKKRVMNEAAARIKDKNKEQGPQAGAKRRTGQSEIANKEEAEKMNSRAKRWRALTAAICIGLGVMTGVVGSLPTAQAEPYGVVMDMRTTQTIPYRIQNFTPYSMTLVSGNRNNISELRFANGIPERIAPAGEEGSWAMVYTMFKTYQGTNVWHPVYTIREDGGNYINIEIATDVEKERVQNMKVEGMPFVLSTIQCLMDIGGTFADPSKIAGYLKLISDIKTADASLNSIEVKNFDWIAGKGYVYGTSSTGSATLMKGNDVWVEQVGDGSNRTQFVVESVAVRLPSLEVWQGLSGLFSSEGGHSDETKKATITIGGKQYVALNVYTQAQYLTIASISIAKEFQKRTGYGEEMSNTADWERDKNLGMNTTTMPMVSGFEVQDFGSNIEMDVSENGAGWHKLAAKLAEGVLRGYRESGKCEWFYDKMSKLSSGERIDVYEALYMAQQRNSKSADKNPLMPRLLRQALEVDGAMVTSSDMNVLADSYQISDQELERKLRLAFTRLGIDPPNAVESTETEGLRPVNTDGF